MIIGLIIGGVIFLIVTIAAVTFKVGMERRLDTVFGKGKRPKHYSLEWEHNRVFIKFAKGKAELRGSFAQGITKDGTYDFNQINFDYLYINPGANIVYLERDWHEFINFIKTIKEHVSIDQSELDKLSNYFEQIDNFQRIKYLGEEKKATNKRNNKTKSSA